MGGRPERTRTQDRRPRSVEEKTEETKLMQPVLPLHQAVLPPGNAIRYYRSSTAQVPLGILQVIRYLAGTTA